MHGIITGRTMFEDFWFHVQFTSTLSYDKFIEEKCEKLVFERVFVYSGHWVSLVFMRKPDKCEVASWWRATDLRQRKLSEWLHKRFKTDAVSTDDTYLFSPPIWLSAQTSDDREYSQVGTTTELIIVEARFTPFEGIRVVQEE